MFSSSTTSPNRLLLRDLLWIVIIIAYALSTESVHALESNHGYGILIIEAEQMTLQVLIDKVIVGFAPFRGKIPAGQHVIMLRGLYDRFRIQEIEVMEGETIKIKINLSGYFCSIIYDKHKKVPYKLNPTMCESSDGWFTHPAPREFYALTRSSLATTLRAKEYLIDLGVGYPNLTSLRLLAGILPVDGQGVLLAHFEMSSSGYQTDFLAGLRVAAELGPMTYGVSVLAGGGGGPRGRREGIVVFEVQFALHFGQRFQVGLALGPQWSWEQLCPSEADVAAIVRSGKIQDIAGLLQPETAADICTHLNGRNPLSDAVGYDLVNNKLVQKIRTYDRQNPNYVFKNEGKSQDILGMFSLATLRMNMNAEYAINDRWNIWIRPSLTIDFHPMLDPRFNPLIPSGGLSIADSPKVTHVLHGQLGVTLKL